MALMGIDTHASLLEDMFNLAVELGSLFKTLDDAASAKDAKPKIKKIRKDGWNQRIHGGDRKPEWKDW